MGSLFALFCQRAALMVGLWQVGMVWPTPPPTASAPMKSPTPAQKATVAPSAPPVVVPHSVPIPSALSTHLPFLPTPLPSIRPSTVTVHNHRSFDPHLSGTIAVTTLPSGVTLWLDGVYLGATPLLLGALPPGHHVVTLTRTGWKTVEFNVELAPGATLVTSRQMQPLPTGSRLQHLGSVMIHGTVEPGTLQIDGITVHLKPNASLPLGAGRHTVSAGIAGHALTRAFTVIPDTTAVLVLDARTVDSYVALVAPLESVLPRWALSMTHNKICIRLREHLAVGYLQDPIFRIDGKSLTLNPPPVLIGHSLYLPATILDRLRRWAH